jgi:UDP-N-acetylglucosamine 1-carboxyvinyltransferase
MALVLAGLCADGETEIADVFHIDRGYDDADGKLRGLGAEVRREGDTVVVPDPAALW